MTTQNSPAVLEGWDSLETAVVGARLPVDVVIEMVELAVVSLVVEDERSDRVGVDDDFSEDAMNDEDGRESALVLVGA